MTVRVCVKTSILRKGTVSTVPMSRPPISGVLTPEVPNHGERMMSLVQRTPAVETAGIEPGVPARLKPCPYEKT